MGVTWLRRQGSVRRHVDGNVLSEPIRMPQASGLSFLHGPTASGHNGGGREGGADVLSISVVIVRAKLACLCFRRRAWAGGLRVGDANSAWSQAMAASGRLVVAAAKRLFWNACCVKES